MPLIYDELRKRATQKLARERPGQTIQATALVHDAYLRLVGSGAAQGWSGRGHFFAAAATAMRRILIERARQKRRQIHGGGRQRRELHPDLVASPEPDEDLLALDTALARLAERDPVKARLVELRYLAGLTGFAYRSLPIGAPRNEPPHETSTGAIRRGVLIEQVSIGQGLPRILEGPASGDA